MKVDIYTAYILIYFIYFFSSLPHLKWTKSVTLILHLIFSLDGEKKKKKKETHLGDETHQIRVVGRGTCSIKAAALILHVQCGKWLKKRLSLDDLVWRHSCERHVKKKWNYSFIQKPWIGLNVETNCQNPARYSVKIKPPNSLWSCVAPRSLHGSKTGEFFRRFTFPLPIKIRLVAWPPLL